MKKSSILIIALGYLFFIWLTLAPLIQNEYLRKSYNTKIMNHQLIKIRVEGRRKGSSQYFAEINYYNQKYDLQIEKWEYEQIKNTGKIDIYYCEKIDKVFTKTSIWVNKRISILGAFLVVFWTAMLKWVFIPYEKKQKSKNDYLIIKSS